MTESIVFSSLGEVKQRISDFADYIRDISENQGEVYIRLDYIPEYPKWRSINDQLLARLGPSGEYKNGFYTVQLTSKEPVMTDEDIVPPTPESYDYDEIAFTTADSKEVPLKPIVPSTEPTRTGIRSIDQKLEAMEQTPPPEPQTSTPAPEPTALPTTDSTVSPFRGDKTGDEPEDYDLKNSITTVGCLYPVLLDVHGNVVDGLHRRQTRQDWPTRTLDSVQNPLQLAMARLVANVCRREVPAEEKTLWLRHIASITKWTPKELAENLPVSYTWVMKYLPDEFKERPGVGPVTRRVTHPKKVIHPPAPASKPQYHCDRCGPRQDADILPVRGLEGEFFCAACGRPLVSSIPLTREAAVGDRWRCPICRATYLLLHDPASGSHRFEEVTA